MLLEKGTLGMADYFLEQELQMIGMPCTKVICFGCLVPRVENKEGGWNILLKIALDQWRWVGKHNYCDIVSQGYYLVYGNGYDYDNGSLSFAWYVGVLFLVMTNMSFQGFGCMVPLGCTQVQVTWRSFIWLHVALWPVEVCSVILGYGMSLTGIVLGHTDTSIFQ